MLTPRPYQAEDIQRAGERKRQLLAHEPGLGKTEIATETVKGALPALVLTKPHLVEQWRRHIEAEYPRNSVSVVSGSPEEKQQALLRGADWTIANYEVLRKPPKAREREAVRMWMPPEKRAAAPPRPRYDGIDEAALEAAGVGRKKRPQNVYRAPRVRSFICDESHVLRTRDSRSKAHRGALQIAKAPSTEYVLLLTATPMWREADDYFGQLQLLDPKRFSSYWSFVGSYCEVEETPWGSNITGAHERRLKYLLQKYVIRRTYSEVGLQIPQVIPKYLYPELSSGGRKRYEALKRNYKEARAAHTAAGSYSEVGAGAMLHELRAVIRDDPSKQTALTDLLENDIDADGYVIFTWYRESAHKLGNALGIPVITGETPAARRDAEIAAAGPRFVANIACLTEGIDLSWMRAVVFFEQDYLPGRMDQARKRVERWRASAPDDTTPVLVYYLLASDTVDEHIDAVASRRGATAEELLALELRS